MREKRIYEKEEKEEKRKDDEMPKSILFVQHTKDSGLAKEIRRIVQELKPWTRISIKIVERAGERLEDQLHKSDPWESSNCGRNMCLPCETSMNDDNSNLKSCTRRSVIYKTWCKYVD